MIAPDCPTILRYTLERSLDFTPGGRFACSDVGDYILGRVVERVTGTTYGLGIGVRQLKDGGLNLWHGGSLPGTSTLAVRTADGFAWVAAFNGRPQDRAAFKGELDRGLWTAKSKVWKWPAGDLFR